MALHDINGTRLWVEAEGNGPTLVFVHEFGGDHPLLAASGRSLQEPLPLRDLQRAGLPASDVPDREDEYGQDIATADLLGVLDALGIEQAHLVGLSMGAYTGLRFALAHPDRVLTLVAASGGSGSFPDTRAHFLEETRALADTILGQNSLDLPGFAASATRTQLKLKNPDAWQEFADHFTEHAPKGSALRSAGCRPVGPHSMTLPAN